MTGSEVALVAAFGGLAALVQAGTGFGGALLLAPVLFATLRPAQAVVLSALLWIVQAAVMTVHLRPHVLGREVRPLAAAALPGLVVGALVLRVAPASALQVGVGIAVLVATALGVAWHARAAPARLAWPAGVLCGALTTSISVNGPPLVLYLTGRGTSPAELRATLAATFLVVDVAAAGVLAASGTLEGPPLAAVAALAVAVPPGIALGLWLAPRVPVRVQVVAVRVLLVALGVASIVAGLA